MQRSSQQRALKTYRDRLGERGIARFEILAPARDRELIRALARRLVESESEASRIRTSIASAIAGEPPSKGGILAALRRSPLVGSELDLSRDASPGRAIDL